MIYLKNFHTSESHENWYNEVFGHAEHESRISFVISIVFGFSILWPVNSTRIEVNFFFPILLRKY